jgi:hypothetical protein
MKNYLDEIDNAYYGGGRPSGRRSNGVKPRQANVLDEIDDSYYSQLKDTEDTVPAVNEKPEAVVKPKVDLTQPMIDSLRERYQDVPFVDSTLENAKPTVPVKPLDQIRADLRAKDKPSWGETLYYNLLSGAGDVAKSYANIPVLAEKLLDKAIPGEQQLTPRAQRLQDMLAKTEELQSVFDESQAKAPLIQRVAGGITRSLPSIGSAALTGNVAGSVPVMFGIQAGSNYEREAEAEGADPLQASAYGAVMGTVEALTEKIPFEEMMAAFGGKGGIKALLRGMTAEGLQEVVTNPLQVISKRLFYNGGQQEPILDAGRELESFLTGAGTMGVLHGAGKTVNVGGKRVGSSTKNQISESPVTEVTGRESPGQVNPLPAFNRLEPEEKTETPGVSGEDNGPAGAAHSETMRIRPEMGAGVSKPSMSGGKGFNTVFSFSDTGGYAEIEPEYLTGNRDKESESGDKDINALAVEMPEMLELVKSINEGKNPLLKQKLGNALGKFVYSGKKGDIKLRNDIFTGERLGVLELNPRKNIDQQVKDFSQRIKESYGDEDIVFKRNRGKVTAYHRNPNLAARVLAHEIGHLADWLPDKTLNRGNILGRVASLKSYMKHLLPEKPGLNNILTDQDRRRLRREATKLTKTEKDAPEPEDEANIKPEDVLAVWNDVNAREKHPDLFKYVSRLGRTEKTQILREAMKGMVKFQLPDSKGKTFKDWSVREKEIYRKLVKEEIVKRRLFEMETVRDELKKLTQVWKPFDAELNQKYTQYRYSSPELYADAISVLFNNPSLLKKEAPAFHRAFFNYLGEKPEVKAVYDEIQTRLGDRKATLDKRLDDVYRMFTAGHMKRNLLNQRRRATIETVTDTLMRGLVDKNQGILKLIRQGEKQGGPLKELARKARWEIEETGYISSEAANYLYDVGNDVLKLLQENGLTVDDAGTYMMLKRITSDRTDLANPLGHTGKTATETLEAMKSRLGEKGYQALEEGVEKYRAIREKLIMPRVREGRLFSPELLEVMDSQKNYAKFNVQHYLEETYGPGTTARVYKQVGTLSDIENPFEVTVLQDISMLRAAKINEAKLAAISYLQQINNLNTKALSKAKKNELVPAGELNIITPAETRYDGVLKKQVPVEPKDTAKALLQVMVDGNLHSFYVGKEIAETFEYQPFEATKVAEIWGMIMSPVKSALVSKNPLWMARNLVRDLRTTYKNIPELKGFKSTARFLKYYRQAFGEASKAVFKGNRSEDLNEMYKGFMLNPDRMYSSRERNSENDLERLSEEYHLDIYDEKGAKTSVSRMRTFLKLLDKAGRVSEMTGKLAGYKYLTNETNRSKEEVAHVVRTRIGTPDTRRAGKWQQVTNNVFIFSNVNKEGWRSAGESIKEDPGTYLWKSMLINVLPKLFLLGLGAGILKKLGFDDDDKWGKLVRAIPEYDKRSYNIIPLGLTGEGKAAYIRLPEDYEGQVFGGIAYQLFRGQLTGKNGVITTLAEQSPYDLENPNPVYGVSHDLVQYYLFHQNPVDEYRGRNVLPDSIFKAGGKEAHRKMFEYAWKSFGGDSIITPSYDLDETALQKALKYPPFNIVGTFVKISDRGKLDEYYAEKDRETERKARETLKLRERIVESAGRLKKEPGVNDMVKLFHELRKDEIIPKGRTFGEFRRQYINYAAYAVKDKTLSMIMAADTTEDRQKLLARAKEDLTPKQFYELKAKLRKMGVVVPNR